MAAASLMLGPVLNAGATTVRGFEGTSQLDNCALNQCYRPPDTMGAVGTTQFLETNNGSITVYNKATGAVQSRVDMSSFWTAAGMPGGAGGDQRVLFDHSTNRWIMIGFGGTGNKINIAVSDTANAGGTWKSTQIVGVSGTTLDYPTLGMDDKGVYIGTNNFAASFTGTSMFSIPKADLFGGAPTVANLTRFDKTATNAQVGAYGFTMQAAVNWDGNTSGTTTVLAASLIDYNLKFHQITGVAAAGATQSVAQNVVVPLYSDPQPARQPDGSRRVSTVGDRISANVYQHAGNLYAVQTITPVGKDFTAIRWTVVDATTGALIETGEISSDGFDYYQGSIAVNAAGQVVIAYNRSGGAAQGLAGRIGFFARTYGLDNLGDLAQTGTELMLRMSDVSDYRCGVHTSVDTACRQRWGDYSAVTFDPLDQSKFYAIGEYAAEWAVIPGFTSTERAIWHTFIAEIGFDVPEPETLALFGVALAALVATSRRKRKMVEVA